MQYSKELKETSVSLKGEPGKVGKEQKSKINDAAT